MILTPESNAELCGQKPGIVGKSTPKKRVRRPAGIIFAIGWIITIISASSCFASDIYKTSDIRMKKIGSIVSSFAEAGEDLSDADVRSAILKEVSKICPLDPKSQPVTTASEGASKEEKAKKADIKFPENYQDIRRKAAENAEKRFKKAQINDYVKVTYERGSKSYTVEGYFFGYGTAEHSVNINGNIIALFDLVPEDRARFDDRYREILKQEYIEREIRNYLDRKNSYLMELLEKEKEEIAKRNENAGYIFVKGRWMSAKELVDTLIGEALSKAMAPAGEAPAAAKSPEEKSGAESSASAAVKTGSPQLDQDSDLIKRVADLKKRAQAEKQRIRTKFAGIDADQGYDNAIWWMKHKDVNLLFNDLADKAPEGDIEILSFDKGPIEKVELHFFHDYFYKAVITFRIATPQAMERLYRTIVETYGKSDQEKGSISDQGGGGKQKDGPPSSEPAPSPDNVTLTWTGSETIGRLDIKPTSDKMAYSSFVLTKESTKVVKEVTALILREKREKTEAEMKKMLEEYGEFKLK